MRKLHLQKYLHSIKSILTLSEEQFILGYQKMAVKLLIIKYLRLRKNIKNHEKKLFDIL
jgi:hypothetical protein